MSQPIVPTGEAFSTKHHTPTVPEEIQWEQDDITLKKTDLPQALQDFQGGHVNPFLFQIQDTVFLSWSIVVNNHAATSRQRAWHPEIPHENEELLIVIMDNREMALSTLERFRKCNPPGVIEVLSEYIDVYFPK